MKTTRVSLTVTWLLAIILVIVSTTVVQAQPAKPRVYILATGGTIAGSAQSSAQASYTPGVLSIEQIILTVPGISQLANLTGVQVCNISSQNMEEAIWFRLWKITDSLFSNNLCDGVVITHGTDTMEETAYFLNLTVRHSNPVVLTGAMRPSTSLSADGPFNLYNSVALAASPDAKGRGVMVVMNDNIYCANDVTKGHTLNTASFTSPNYGPLGHVRDGKPCFDRTNKFVHTTSSCFDISNLTKLPATEIVYSYAFASDAAINAVIESGAKGIVIAGVGHGNYNRPIAEAINRATTKGISVVRSSRIPSGGVDTAAEEFDPAQPVAFNKSPQKARILLMLALTKSGDPATIQEIFMKY
jgi:L-asparaginase